MRFVLVHSPVVGPATWRWVADALVTTGHEATVPDLTSAALTGDPHVFVDVARRSMPIGDCVVAGHSGAGFLLPSIAAGQRGVPRRRTHRRGPRLALVERLGAHLDIVDDAESIARELVALA